MSFEIIQNDITLGANIDAAQEAARFGIRADHQGTAIIYKAMNASVCSVRAARPLENDWHAAIDADFENRK